MSTTLPRNKQHYTSHLPHTLLSCGSSRSLNTIEEEQDTAGLVLGAHRKRAGTVKEWKSLKCKFEFSFVRCSVKIVTREVEEKSTDWFSSVQCKKIVQHPVREQPTHNERRVRMNWWIFQSFAQNYNKSMATKKEMKIKCKWKSEKFIDVVKLNWMMMMKIK